MWTRCTYEQHERLFAARQALLGSLTRRNQAGVHRVVVEVLFQDGERSLEPSPGSRPPRLPDFGRRADDGAPLGQSSAVPGKSHWFGHACLYRAHFVTMDSDVRF